MINYSQFNTTLDHSYNIARAIDYCKKNNIQLIRIPYWEFNDEGYINILNKEIYNI